MSLLKSIFTWWNTQTIGTMVTTRLYGEKVGEDDQGNAYYQSKGGAKRWVIYNGDIEASRVSPEWHGWLHQTYQDPPTKDPLPRKAWEKPHQPNLTGTDMAYAPAGSLRAATPVDRSDYEAWQPE